MRLLVVLAVFAMITVGRCADAGIIVDATRVQASVTSDLQATMAIMNSMTQSAPGPIQIEQGDRDGLNGLAVLTGQRVSPSVACTDDVRLRVDARLVWRISIVNAILPPSPDLGALQKPS